MHLRARTERFRSEIGRSSRACSSGDIVARSTTGSARLGLGGELAQLQALGVQHLADLDERRLAEILAGQQLLLAASRQIAERADAHLLQAIAAADRQLEIGDGNVEHRGQAVLPALGVFVVEHVARGRGVFEIQPGPRMVGIRIEDALVAQLRPVELLAIFVEHAQVQQRADVGGKLAAARW